MTLKEELQKYLEEDLEEFYNSTYYKTRLKFNQFKNYSKGHHGPESEYAIVEFFGGLNGRGNWFNYLQDITVLFDILESKYNCWLVNLENDCLDDVFYLIIGIARK